MKNKISFSRRSMLEVMGGLGGTFLLKKSFDQTAHAQVGGPPKYLVMCYFEGGWDQLLALDPRPNNVAKYTRGTPSFTRVEPAYTLSDGDAQVQGVLVNNPTYLAAGTTTVTGSGVQQAGNLTFGPAVPKSLTTHFNDLCIIRGVNMSTLTHDVGRRYWLTGRFPAGLLAVGSSLNTVVANSGPRTFDLPNLSINNESYNVGLPASMSATKIRTASDLLTLLAEQGPVLSDIQKSSLATWAASTQQSCRENELNVDNAVSDFKEARDQAGLLVASQKSSLFQFTFNSTDPKIVAVMSKFGINTTSNNTINADMATPKGSAAIAAMALANGISQTVSIRVANGIDDHFELGTDHATNLKNGFEAIGDLISFLKQTDDPAQPTQKLWASTTLMCFSEFARTPMINARDGRDHHLCSSMLLAGPKIKGNTVFGASNDQEMGTAEVTFDGTGRVIKPIDVHATILQSMGLPHDHLRDERHIISPILKP